MKISKILIAYIVALSVEPFTEAAQATPVTAVWTGTLTSGSYSTPSNNINDQSSLGGVSVQLTFTYDSAAATAAIGGDHGAYQYSTANSDPNFYSSVSVILGNGASFSTTTPLAQAELDLGNASDALTGLYENYATDGSFNQFEAYSFGPDGLATHDASANFAYAPTGNDSTLIKTVFSDNGVNYYGWGGTINFVSVTGGDSSDAVPTPGALPLLGLGLIGLGGMRRKAGRAQA